MCYLLSVSLFLGLAHRCKFCSHRTLPVLQLEVQGRRSLSAWLWLLLQQAARTGQILALTGYMQGCVTMLVLQNSACPLQHQCPDDIRLIQMNSQMQCCL